MTIGAEQGNVEMGVFHTVDGSTSCTSGAVTASSSGLTAGRRGHGKATNQAASERSRPRRGFRDDRHRVVLAMKGHEGRQVVLVDEDVGDDRFPLLLLLDAVDNIGGVWKSDNGVIVIQLSEVMSKFQGQPLQMKYSLERSQTRHVDGVVLPVGIESFHDVVVVGQEICEMMAHRKDGSVDCLHSTDGADGIIGAWHIDFHLQQDLGISQGGGRPTTLHKSNLSINTLLHFHIRVSKQERISQGARFQSIGV
jgi:hypothetical protein